MPRRLAAFLKNFGLAAASVVATVVLLELLLRFLPVATAPPFEPPTPANPIQRYVPNTPYTWSLGWNFYYVNRGASNGQGFLADYDYDRAATTPLVAVVGDSMIEALHVSFKDSVPGRLQAMLGSRGRAYAFAQSGAPLSQYLAYAQHASAYHPQRMVVNVVGNDFDESVFTHRLRDGFFHLYPKPDGTFEYKLTPFHPPSLAERAFRHSALALYLARNIGLRNVVNWFRPNAAQAESDWQQYVGMTSARADPARVAEGYAVIGWFLDNLPGAAHLDPSEIVILVDAARPHIYDAATREYAHTSYFGKMRERLIAEARARNIKVVDLEPVFLSAYEKTGRIFEYPTDAHWTSYAHGVVTEAVRSALADWPPLANAPARQEPAVH